MAIFWLVCHEIRLKKQHFIPDRDHSRPVIYSADIGIVIVNNLADAATYGEFKGLLNDGRTIIMVSFDFLLDKIMILHEIGHALGAAHQYNKPIPEYGTIYKS